MTPRWGRSLTATAVALAGLLIVVASPRSALAAPASEPGVKVAPGVYLAPAPSGGRARPVERASPAPQRRIVGGDTTTIDTWPWQAAVTLNPAKYPDEGDALDRLLCGGALVAPSIIVTAAHCVYDEEGKTFYPVNDHASVTGRTTLSNASQGQEIAWSNFFVFVNGAGKPRYNHNTSEWDVVFAVLASPSPAASSTPIKIAGASEAAAWAPGDENLWATGWGATLSAGPSSDTLRAVNIDRIADATCGSPTSYGNAFKPQTMLCAGEILGGQDTCQGDSGGPLVTPIGGGAFRLVGDTSFGAGCGLPNLPGVYGRVAEVPMCTALRNAILQVPAGGVDVVGSGGCLGEPPPPDDTDPPETTITKRPSNRTARRTVRYGFVSDEAGSSFKCRLDRKPWRGCSSPKTLRRLSAGRHVFRVRATDPAGNPDPTPAADRFRVVR